MYRISKNNIKYIYITWMYTIPTTVVIQERERGTEREREREESRRMKTIENFSLSLLYMSILWTYVVTACLNICLSDFFRIYKWSMIWAIRRWKQEDQEFKVTLQLPLAFIQSLTSWELLLHNKVIILLVMGEKRRRKCGNKKPSSLEAWSVWGGGTGPPL